MLVVLQIKFERLSCLKTLETKKNNNTASSVTPICWGRVGWSASRVAIKASNDNSYHREGRGSRCRRAYFDVALVGGDTFRSLSFLLRRLVCVLV